jgi:formyl-CoA transferase
VALYESVFAMMESLIPEFDVFGFIRERTGNVMPGITPSNTHTSKDGKHLIIGANGDAIFRRLMQAIGRSDLADDPQLATNAGRDTRASEIYGVIGDWVAANPADEVLRVTSAASVPASPVFSVADMVKDPQFLFRNMIESARLPDGKVFKVPGIVPKLSLTPGNSEWIGPELGADTDMVLKNLGYTKNEIVSLRDGGAI